MLLNLLPGLREVRAPLISGYLWLAFLFLVFNHELPSKSERDSVLFPILDLGDDLSVLVLATVTGVAAYLIGSAVQELLKLLGSIFSRSRPLYGEAGARTSAAGRHDVGDALRIRVQGIKRDLFQVALSPGEKGIDEAPTGEVIERELPLVRTLLLGERPELVGELDRVQAEADLRITVSFPVGFFGVYLAVESSWGWLGLLLPAVLLLIQGYQRYLEAGDLLAKALRIGKADAPALQALASSADAVLQRMELEGELRKLMDGGDGMAAFRLGNLQASWGDFEAAASALELATSGGVVRAYAELGLVHQQRGDREQAERAYRDGAERGDEKATKLLAAFLSSLQRDEEARETAKRFEHPSETATPVRPPEDRSRSDVAAYRRRIKEGDAKAAINLGLFLSRDGDTKGATEAFLKATELDERDADAWFQLGMLKNAEKRYAEAKAAYERALEIREEEFGPEHLEVAIALGNLATTLDGLGEYEEGLNLQSRALALFEKHLGPEHLRVATALGNLGGSYERLGRYERARELEERALAIKESELGPEALSVAVTLGNLANALGRLGEAGAARDLYERSLEIKETELGDREHLDLAVSLRNFAECMRELGDYEKARELHARALTIERKHLGDGHLDVGMTRSSLAATLAHLGERGEAAEQGELALGVIERFGDHPGVGVALREVSVAWLRLGRAREALELAERALELQRATLGGSHPEVAETLDLSARILAALNQDEQAGDARARAAEIRREHAKLEASPPRDDAR